ncbi:MAG: hypothetical protein CMP93_00530 [Gammaproteobacteria bacterium]|nr:hypothetical protein [Gammaproteobacteria bacterium]
MPNFRVKKLAIVGLGMIGASIAKAVKKKLLADRIVAIDRSIEHLRYGVDQGLIDEQVDRVPKDAELVAFCAPMASFGEIIESVEPHSGVFFDVASVKTPLTEALSRMSKGSMARFVPCHPIAGSEKTGPENGQERLFENSLVAITPLAFTDKDAVAKVEQLWSAIGAKTLRMSADEHDKALAVTSHLPHFLSFAYMLGVDKKLETLTGGGYRDFTRIAAADPELWWGIFQMNREELLRALEKFRLDIDALEEMLVADDHEAGIRALADAVRRKLG